MVNHMKVSELQRKDIININDGKIVGRIIDIEIDETNGNLINLIIDRTKYIKSLFSTDEGSKITFEQIKKIGSDVILVEL